MIFAIGVLCGALGDHIYYKAKIKKYMTGERNYYQEIVVKNLNKKLELDALQREKVQGIVKDMFAEMRSVRRQYWPQTEAILEKKRAEIKTILRPDQIEAYDKIIAEQKAKAKRYWQKE